MSDHPTIPLDQYREYPIEEMRARLEEYREKRTLPFFLWVRFLAGQKLTQMHRKHLGAIAGVNMSAMVIASGIGPVVFAGCQQLLGSYVVALTGSVLVPAIFAVLGWILGDNPQRKLPDCP